MKRLMLVFLALAVVAAMSFSQVQGGQCPAVGHRVVPRTCLRCICESQPDCPCRMPSPVCQGSGKKRECGPYRITEKYWRQARKKGGQLGGEWELCASSFACSELTVHGFMRGVATKRRLGHWPKCEDYARLHFGGKRGYLKRPALKFWKEVQKCLGKEGKKNKSKSKMPQKKKHVKKWLKKNYS